MGLLVGEMGKEPAFASQLQRIWRKGGILDSSRILRPYYRGRTRFCPSSFGSSVEVGKGRVFYRSIPRKLLETKTSRVFGGICNVATSRSWTVTRGRCASTSSATARASLHATRCDLPAIHRVAPRPSQTSRKIEYHYDADHSSFSQAWRWHVAPVQADRYGMRYRHRFADQHPLAKPTFSNAPYPQVRPQVSD